MDGIIAANGGFITRAQALDCGATDRDLRRALRDRELVRIRRGIYVPAEIHRGLDDVGRHVLLAKAVVSVQAGEVAVCGASAAALHGLELQGQDLSVVHLVRLDTATTRTDAQVTHHVMNLDREPDLVVREGIATTSVSRTAWDVARMSTLEGGVVTVDSALRLQPSLESALLEVYGRSRHQPGARTARLALALADGRSANGGESYTRVQFFRHHIPRPELQVPVYDSSGRELGVTDFYWEQFRHVVEFDGKIKYLKHLRAGESPSDAVFREKRREDAIRGTGRGMTRLVWSDVLKRRVERTMANLRSNLEQSRRLYVQRPVA